MYNYFDIHLLLSTKEENINKHFIFVSFVMCNIMTAALHLSILEEGSRQLSNHY